MAGVCLLLVVLAASLSWLRWGIDHHPLYHQWVEQEVSRAIGQELILDSFQVKLVGTRLQLDLEGIKTLEGLSLARLALGVDLWESLQADVLRFSHVQATGLSINIGQQNDGTWGPRATLEGGSQTVPQLMLAVAGRVPQLLLDDVALTLTPKQGQAISLPKLNAQVRVLENTGIGLTRIALSLYGDVDTKVQNSSVQAQVTLSLKTNETLSLKTNETIQRAQVYVHSNSLEIAPWLSLLPPDKSSFYPERLRLGGKYWLDYQANKHLQLVTENAQILLVTPTGEVDLTGDISATSQLGGHQTLDWTLLDWNLTAKALSGLVNGVTLPLHEIQARKIDQRLLVSSPKVHLADTRLLLNTIKGLPAKINFPIQSLGPKGWLHQVQLHLDVQQPKEFLFTGHMQQASINAWVGVPQIKQADGQIWLNRYGGKVAINDTDGLQLRITNLTTQPWQLTSVQGEFNWHYGALVNQVRSSNLAISLGQGQGHVNLKMAAAFPRKGSDAEPFIQLALGMQNLDLATLPSMLPDVVLGEGLGAWLTMAAPIGQVTEAALIYNGRPGKISSTAGTVGDISRSMARSMPIAAHVETPSFSYHQDWPLVQGLKADLTVGHKGVSVEALAGSVEHGQITQPVKGWRVEVPLYNKAGYKTAGYQAADNQTGDQEPSYITVHGQMAGEALQIMTLAQELPIHLNLPSWLHALNPEGEVSLQGSIAIPFGHKSATTYDLKLSSDNLTGYWAPLQADLRHVELEVGLSSTHAGIGDITGNGLIDGQSVTFKRLSNIHLSKVSLEKPWLSQVPSKILHDVNANLNSKQGNLTLEFQGRLAPHYLATKVSQPWVEEISGVLPFVARFSTCTHTTVLCTSLSAEVDLSNAGIDLPDPLHQLQQLQLLGYWQQDDQNWYASLDQHHVAIKLGADENSNGLVILGANAAFQSAVDWAQQGQWTLGGQIEFVDVEPWWDVYKNHMQSWWVTADKEPAAVVLPNIDVKIKRATWNGQEIDQASITAQAIDEAGGLQTMQPWRLRFTSEQFAGKVDYFGAEQPLVVHIDHAHLIFPEPVNETAEHIDLLENIDPGKFPDADVSIDELIKNGESFGQWQFKMRRQGTQVNVHDLEAYVRHSRLQGNLTWAKMDGAHRTQFTGRVASSDITSLLIAWGYEPAVIAETSAIEVQLNWPRSPAAFSVQDISGDVGLRFKKGNFSSAPDAAKGLKILALLDMSRLMKRIQLDFSDIIQPGFRFDSVAAHYRFEQGVASTVSPLTLKSTTLNLTMDGWIDFNRRQVDNNLVVTLPLADKLPLVALVAGLPQLSGMIYVINKLIGDELATFTSARYSVVGSLDNPDVKLVKMFDKDYQQQSVQERIENVITIE
jgi:uncharacterized protein YhdP